MHVVPKGSKKIYVYEKGADKNYLGKTTYIIDKKTKVNLMHLRTFCLT